MWMLIIAAALTPADELLLVCDGSTMAQMDSSSSVASVHDSDGYSAYGSVDTREPGVARFSVQLRVVAGQAEMTMPALAAPEYSSNRGGWFKVKNLQMTDAEISGRVRFNFLSSSTFRIDRRTGEISSSGGFHGTCRKQDLSQRAF